MLRGRQTPFVGFDYMGHAFCKKSSILSSAQDCKLYSLINNYWGVLDTVDPRRQSPRQI